MLKQNLPQSVIKEIVKSNFAKFLSINSYLLIMNWTYISGPDKLKCNLNQTEIQVSMHLFLSFFLPHSDHSTTVFFQSSSRDEWWYSNIFRSQLWSKKLQCLIYNLKYHNTYDKMLKSSEFVNVDLRWIFSEYWKCQSFLWSRHWHNPCILKVGGHNSLASASHITMS